jgi:enamine deaminase RidA (YjgF/YER057c/UK114 family)
MKFEFNLKGNRRGAIAAMAIAVFVSASLVFLTASEQNTKRIPLPASQNPSNRDLPISAAVWAGDTLYVSGWLDPERKTHTDTASQTVGIIKDIQKLLESQKLTLGDVAMMRVYLGADPVKGSKGDFDGMMAGYSQFFGTKDQPNKPARTTVQVVLPAGARGGLVEIDLIAVLCLVYLWREPHMTQTSGAVASESGRCAVAVT